MAGIGDQTQPVTGAAPGVPPTDPNAHADLTGRWLQYLKSPALGAGLFQFGASMLSQIGNTAPIGARIGTSLSDAGRAAGNTAKFAIDQGNTERQLGQGDTRINQEQQRIQQEGVNAKNTNAYQTRSLDLTEAGQKQNASQALAELGMRSKELASSDTFKKMQLEIEQQQANTSASMVQTPRDRAMLSLITQAAKLDPALDDPQAFIENGMAAIDKIFPLAPSQAPGGVSPAPAANAAPGAAPVTPPVAGATINPPVPPTAAIGMLKQNPTPQAKTQFDEIFGAGAADRALGAH